MRKTGQHRAPRRSFRRGRHAALYALLVAGVSMGMATLGLTWAATSASSPVAERLATAGSQLAVTNGPSGAVWTAKFDPVLVGDSLAYLQLKTIRTTFLNDRAGKRVVVDNWQDSSSWKTIAVVRPRDGVAEFSLPDPLEVTHLYRAVIHPGPAEVATRQVEYAAPRTRQDDGLPTVYVDTDDGSPIGESGSAWEGQLTVKGTGDGRCADSSPATAKIAGVGDFTWERDKPDIAVTLAHDAALCGLPNSSHLTLYGDRYDRSLLRTSVGLHLATKLDGLTWTSDLIPVDLYVNGELRGVYGLGTRHSFAPRGSVTQDSSTPQMSKSTPTPRATSKDEFLLRWDTDSKEPNFVKLEQYGLTVVEHESGNDDGELTQEQRDYVRTYLSKADAALRGQEFTDSTNGWRAYIDERCAVDYYLLMEYTKNVALTDPRGSFMYKAADSASGPGKLCFGPVQGFDASMGSTGFPGNQASPTGWYPNGSAATTNTWLKRLNDDPEFRKAVKARWLEVRGHFSDLRGWIDDQAAHLSSGAKFDSNRWNSVTPRDESHIVHGAWSTEVAALSTWTAARTDWFDSQFH